MTGGELRVGPRTPFNTLRMVANFDPADADVADLLEVLVIP